MVIISYSKLRNFYDLHADAKDALNNNAGTLAEPRGAII